MVVRSTCETHAAELRPAGIRHLSLFGSTARGEAGAESDVDLAVELDREAHIGLFGLDGIGSRISEILGRKVDLIPEPMEKRRLQENIDRDGACLLSTIRLTAWQISSTTSRASKCTYFLPGMSRDDFAERWTNLRCSRAMLGAHLRGCIQAR